VQKGHRGYDSGKKDENPHWNFMQKMKDTGI
jgi:hypothetical protein